ncbi:hypothetical protein ACFQ3X_42175, partial [Plantactinospora endophytica]
PTAEVSTEPGTVQAIVGLSQQDDLGVQLSECLRGLGRQLLMLIEGATTVAEHRGPASTDGHARRAALTLLAATTPDVSAWSSRGNQTWSFSRRPRSTTATPGVCRRTLVTRDAKAVAPALSPGLCPCRRLAVA